MVSISRGEIGGASIFPAGDDFVAKIEKEKQRNKPYEASMWGGCLFVGLGLVLGLSADCHIDTIRSMTADFVLFLFCLYVSRSHSLTYMSPFVCPFFDDHKGFDPSLH